MAKMEPIEVVKYIKFPDRRLVSGFLTVNVVSHEDNDSLDDANQEYYDGWGGSENFEESYPFNDDQPDNPGRVNYKHSFGDYDCLLFWIAGGMTLHNITFSGSRMTQSQLHSAGFLNAATGSTSWTDGAGSPSATFDSNEHWFLSSNVLHPCQHFLKSHLISRINNGYGHTNTNYYKIPGIKTDQYEYNTNVVADLNNNITSTATNSTPNNREGNNHRFIVSNGRFSNDSDGHFINDLSVTSNNTYFPMVEGVDVYGKHNFTLPSHNDGGGNLVYTSGNSTVGNFAHESNFWSMIIKIKLRGYSPSATSGDATHEFFKTRTNVAFHPFGETGSFSIGNSLHTS
jgi:hypothetical protein